MIEAVVDDRALQAMLKRLTGDVSELAIQCTEGAVLLHQKAMAQRVKGPALMRRTGALVRSLRSTPATRIGSTIDARSHIGRGAPYARVHEKGATIRPKKGRYLTIPLDAAKTPAGVPRAAAKLRNVGGKWQTTNKVPGASGLDTFIFSKGQRKFIAVRSGGGLLPLYVLKRQVRISARLGFRDTFLRQSDQRRRLYAKNVKRYIKGNL